MNNISNEEASYIAGIVDGEGSIMLIRFNRGKSPSPCLSISSTSYELLDWISSRTGVGTIISKKNYDPVRHQDSYSYSVRYDNALDLIKAISPYLVIDEKRQKAELLLSGYKKHTVRNGRYTAQQLKEKEDFFTMFSSIK